MILLYLPDKIKSYAIVSPNAPVAMSSPSSSLPSARKSIRSILLSDAVLTPAARSNVFEFSLMGLQNIQKQRRHLKAVTAQSDSTAASTKTPYILLSTTPITMLERNQKHDGIKTEASKLLSDMNPVFSIGAFTYYNPELPSTVEVAANFAQNHRKALAAMTHSSQRHNVKNSAEKILSARRRFIDVKWRTQGAANTERVSDSFEMGIITVMKSPQLSSTRPTLHWGDSSENVLKDANTGRSSSGNYISDDSNISTTPAAAGLAVFMFSLTAVIFLFLLFYLISRFFHHSIAMSHAMTGHFDTTTHSIENNFSSASQLSGRKFNLLAKHFANEPNSILYPKRIYELQAEEGCLNAPLGFPIAAGLAAASAPSYLLNASGYAEHNCGMNSVLLAGNHTNGGDVQKKKSTVSIKSLSKPNVMKNLAKNCSQNIACKLNGIEIPLSKEKLHRIQHLRNRELSSS